jgi:hypothetical protein
MNYSDFLTLIMSTKKYNSDISELYDIGFNLLDGKYSLSEQFNNVVKTSFLSHYTLEGYEWIEWFMYDAEYGQKDFSKVPTYKILEDGSHVKIKEIGEVRWGAEDKEGNPIAYSYESLYELVERDHKIVKD